MNLEQKKITREINKALNDGFKIDTDSDQQYLDGQDYNWNDLNNFKEELGSSVVKFAQQVSEITVRPEIINNLGDKREHFNKVVTVFFNDINSFSNKVKELRLQHEQFSGPVKDINEFNLYNRLAISYQALYTELTTLITPTLSDIMLTVTEILGSVIEQPT